jgi:branched-chain amino acid transport system substrate-binding protein
MTFLTHTTKGGRSRTLVGVGIVAITAMLLAGCSARVGNTTSSAGADSSGLTAKCTNYKATQGVTKDQILIGGSLSLTGPNATVGVASNGIKAYFDSVNAQGGIHGRKLKLIMLDDAYDPSKTTTNVNQEVNQDGVFAFISLLGTANVLAVQPMLESNCIPNLMVASGAPAVAGVANKWTIPGLPNYTQDATVLAQQVIRSGAKTVSTMTMSGDFGDSYVSGLKAALQGSGVKVIDNQSFQFGAPDVSSQLTHLASTKADAVLVAALGTQCPQAINGIQQSGWQPKIFIDQLCTNKGLLGLLQNGAGNGMISTAWYKSPTDPQWADDSAMKAYKTALAKYAPNADATQDFAFNGWLWAQIFVHILKSAKTMTRASVMDAARQVNFAPDTLLPGIKYSLDSSTFNPLSKLQVESYVASDHTFPFLNPKTGKVLDAGTIDLSATTN